MTPHRAWQQGDWRTGEEKAAQRKPCLLLGSSVCTLNTSPDAKERRGERVGTNDTQNIYISEIVPECLLSRSDAFAKPMSLASVGTEHSSGFNTQEKQGSKGSDSFQFI